MAQIGIIEIFEKNHEVADLCRIATADGQNKVTLYTTKEIAGVVKMELVDDNNMVTIITKPKNESLWSFMKQIQAESSTLQLLIANTLTHWTFYFFNPKCLFGGYFYNLNWWFYDTHSIKNNFKKIFSLKNWFAENPVYHILTGAFIRKKIALKCNFALFEYKPLIDELLTNSKYTWDKPTYFFPNRPFDPSYKIKDRSKRFVLALPGQVQKMRRNYDQVLEIYKYLDNSLKNKFKLIIIGRERGQYGKKIHEKCDNLIKEGWDIKFTKRFVDPDAFSNYMLQSHMMVAPLKFDFIDYTRTEIYTYTKGTGSFSDGLKYGLPTLAPEKYNVYPDIEDFFFLYKNSKHLAEIVSKYATNPDLLNADLEKGEKAMMQFSFKKSQQNFQIMCKDLGIVD